MNSLILIFIIITSIILYFAGVILSYMAITRFFIRLPPSKQIFPEERIEFIFLSLLSWIALVSFFVVLLIYYLFKSIFPSFVKFFKKLEPD